MYVSLMPRCGTEYIFSGSCNNLLYFQNNNRQTMGHGIVHMQAQHSKFNFHIKLMFTDIFTFIDNVHNQLIPIVEIVYASQWFTWKLKTKWGELEIIKKYIVLTTNINASPKQHLVHSQNTNSFWEHWSKRCVFYQWRRDSHIISWFH